jgi:hypothetical protein
MRTAIQNPVYCTANDSLHPMLSIYLFLSNLSLIYKSVIGQPK